MFLAPNLSVLIPEQILKKTLRSKNPCIKKNKHSRFFYPSCKKLAFDNFDHMDENDQTSLKANSTTCGPKIKVNSVVEFSRLTLSNEILIKRT